MQVVRDLFESWQTKDVDQILAHLADDVIIWDMPFGTRHNRGEFGDRMKWFLGFWSELEANVINIAVTESGDVFFERTDRFKADDEWVEFPAAGIAVVRGGKVAEIREYYDAEAASKLVTQASGQPFKEAAVWPESHA
jgi:limonene-1,2-epoxide hydrolase